MDCNKASKIGVNILNENNGIYFIEIVDNNMFKWLYKIIKN